MIMRGVEAAFGRLKSMTHFSKSGVIEAVRVRAVDLSQIGVLCEFV